MQQQQLSDLIGYVTAGRPDAEVEEELGLSRIQLWRWENGKTSPTKRSRKTLLDAAAAKARKEKQVPSGIAELLRLSGYRVTAEVVA